MAQVSDVLTYARQLLQTDSSGLSDAVGLAMTNDALQDEVREFIRRGVNAAQTRESYTPITTASPNTYPWPTAMFQLKSIEVDFTGGGGQNFLQANAVDVSNIQFVSWEWLRANQPTTKPLFNNRGDTFEIFPTPLTATGSIKIFYFLIPTEYSSTSSTISYPQSLDYRALSAKVAEMYSLTLEKPDMVTAFAQEYQTRIDKMVNILVPASQTPIQSTPIQLTGWEF